QRGGQREFEDVVGNRFRLVAALGAVRKEQGERALPGPGPARLGGQPEALLDQVGDGAGHGVSAARVIVVVSRLCHSEAAKASLIFSSGYLCERMRLHGERSRVRTRRATGA